MLMEGVQMATQVFISYRRADGFYPALLLYRELIAANYSVFFDIKSIRMGKFPDIIKQNIEECTDFILIVSPSTFSERIFDDNDWVRKEIRLALSLNKNIITVFINTTIPETLPEDIDKIRYFNGIQQLDPNLISENYKRLFKDFMISHPQIKPSPFVNRRCSAYDVNFGDEFGRLQIQSRNSLNSDLSVLKKVNAGGVVLDVGCAFGVVTLSRFDSDNYTRVIGIDKDNDSVAYACEHTPEKFDFAVMDVEASDFRDQLSALMQSKNIESFDVIFISLVLHHLRDPYAALRKLRRFLSHDGVIIVRGSDDGTKIAYPDEQALLPTIISKTLQAHNVSDRLHGRKIYDWLKQSGFANVKMYSFMRDTSSFDLDEREDLFRESFSYRINYFHKQLKLEPYTEENFHAFEEMETLLALFENEFMKETFWYAEYDYIGVGYKK